MVGALRALTVAGLILYTGTGKAQSLNAVHPAGETACLVYLKFDEPAGAVCNDSSGHGNHVQVLNGVHESDKKLSPVIYRPQVQTFIFRDVPGQRPNRVRACP